MRNRRGGLRYIWNIKICVLNMLLIQRGRGEAYAAQQDINKTQAMHASDSAFKAQQQRFSVEYSFKLLCTKLILC